MLLAGIEGKSSDAVFFKPLSNSFLVVFGVKKRSVPLYSIAPFSGVVKLAPVVSFMGAEPAVAEPALICNVAVGFCSVNPTFPVLLTMMRSL